VGGVLRELTTRRIIFVPGMKPKPPPEQHRTELLRVLTSGLRRVRPQAAHLLALHPQLFEVVPWTYAFHGSHRDVALDLPGIERLLEQSAPTPEDLSELRSWPRRLARFWHRLGDAVPLFVTLTARPALRETMREVQRYLANRDGIADDIRARLRAPLERAWSQGEEVLLIAHSLGSVIAYDTLWELSHVQRAPGRVDLFVTLGSPLATGFIYRELRGAREPGRRRYPTNIRRWVNFASLGDVTALRPMLAKYFGEMRSLGLIESIDDRVDLTNYYRDGGRLNAHEAYGYLVQPALAELVGDWLIEPTRAAAR
jgi:hypothetical protein